jgi:hypothetical protein
MLRTPWHGKHAKSTSPHDGERFCSSKITTLFPGNLLSMSLTITSGNAFWALHPRVVSKVFDFFPKCYGKAVKLAECIITHRYNSYYQNLLILSTNSVQRSLWDSKSCLSNPHQNTNPFYLFSVQKRSHLPSQMECNHHRVPMDNLTVEAFFQEKHTIFGTESD